MGDFYQLAGTSARLSAMKGGRNWQLVSTSLWVSGLLCVVSFFAMGPALLAAEFYVSPDGDDGNPGTAEKPFASIGHARDVIRESPFRGMEPIRVTLGAGVYRLPETLVFTSEDSGAENAVIEYRGAEGGLSIISGGLEMKGLEWQVYQEGVMQAKLPQGFTTDQLFVNGDLMPMARYPNFDAKARFFNGSAADATSDARVAKWSDPTGGFIHVMHGSLWGGMHYRITGKDPKGKLIYEGGWQNNRGQKQHKDARFVENIFEELDAPGEWYINPKTATLYFQPPAGLDLANAKFEAVRLDHLIEFRGDAKLPVKFISLEGLAFQHARRTFMENKEPMLRTDWTVYRGGALFVNGSEDCGIWDCEIRDVGGNALFVNNYNRRLTIRACNIHDVGANGVAFVGDPAAVRDGLVGYDSRSTFEKIDKTPGPKTSNYPADSLVGDCLIHRTGRIEKQTAGVEIDMSMNITVRHCSVYDMPRAGVNIGDGCWGGHLIEFCDVFDTVLETGDHGSFNSWGRDRFWGLKGIDLDTITLGENRNLPLLDVIHPNILRDNRWRCDHGWDIDLDDGSSNYQIRNNLCLNGGIKNREGFYRTVENNIMVNNGFHPHVWYGNSGDVFRRNIVYQGYRPAIMPETEAWGKELDSNLVVSKMETGPALVLSGMSKRDRNSILADPGFIDPAKGDYRVRDGSPALELGFVNFPMDQFGVKAPKLRAVARTPDLPPPGEMEKANKDRRPQPWLGAMVRNLSGMGDVSAAGLADENGALVSEVKSGSPAAKAGLKKGDVILSCAGTRFDSVATLLGVWHSTASGDVPLEIWRDQKSIHVIIRKS